MRDWQKDLVRRLALAGGGLLLLAGGYWLGVALASVGG